MSTRCALFGWSAAMLAIVGTGCVSFGELGKSSSPPRGFVVDARWEPHSAYLNSLAAKVNRQWRQVLVSSRNYPKSGSLVKVRFELDSSGAIAKIISVEGDADMNGQKACVAAIAAGSPYPPWSDAMKARLAGTEELTFTFRYQ